MKKLDLLVVKSFIGPFILTFLIALFVLVLQFLWKYIDDLIGKGLNTWVLAELLFYASAKLVPLALPLAMLLSSIMTFGSFGEHLELTAVKSAGISLLRFMTPLIGTSILVSIFAFVFSNNILPMANLKFSALLYDIRHQKPSVAIKEKIFYTQIENFYLRVESKSETGDSLYGMTVYDHSSGKGNDHVITAKKGMMVQNDDDLLLQMFLFGGEEYREMESKKDEKPSYDYIHTSFDSWEKRFDLSEFKLNRSDENFFKDLKQMLNLNQLLGQIDTLHIEMDDFRNNTLNMTNPYYNSRKLGLDTLKTVNDAIKNQKNDFNSIFNSFPTSSKKIVYEKALSKARTVKGYATSMTTQLSFKVKNVTEYIIEVYRKFTLSIACLVLFFIGAPLGSIIRKGGLGWPMFYSVILFIIYHVLSMMGEKMAKKEVLSAFEGMWLSTLILLPIGVFLTLKATQDSKLFSADFYLSKLKKRKSIS